MQQQRHLVHHISKCCARKVSRHEHHMTSEKLGSAPGLFGKGSARGFKEGESSMLGTETRAASCEGRNRDGAEGVQRHATSCVFVFKFKAARPG